MTRRREDVKSNFKQTPCKCPMCESEHSQYIFFTGRGVCRKYCETCERIVERGDFANIAIDHGASSRRDSWYEQYTILDDDNVTIPMY